MSQPNVPPDPEMNAIEAALRSLAPSPSRLDRDALMFRAGQAAPRPSHARWLWPMIAACLALIATGEAALLAVRPEPRVIERLVVIHEPAPAPIEPAPSMAQDSEKLAPVVILRQSSGEERHTLNADLPWPLEPSYAQLRNRVLRFGIDALPEPPPLAMKSPLEDPVPSRRLLRSEIERILNPGEPS